MATIPSHLKIPMRPQATAKAVVLAGSARFSWLTPRIIRMEYSESGDFEERASQAFWFREQPEVQFTEKRNRKDGQEVLELENDYLKLVYHGGVFSSETLSVEVKATKTIWHHGDPATGNLGGTGRTLDGALGAIPIEDGLISRDGWSVVDDSQSLVFDADCWLIPRNAPTGKKDLYFFGFGHEYAACLVDYSKITGDVAMIPRWALGNWWSRYWEFSQAELTELMQDFKDHQIPLGVCIIDMDWHITKTENESSGWTGYTWNRDLFPDPQGQLAWLHEQGLRVALNLHPADGIHPHEEQYPEMARRMGIDPESKQPVEFDIANPEFVNAYFEVLHHPQEAMGIDFWWMDWQQGTKSKVQGLDPLWWLNHLHFYDLSRGGKKRSFIFSRWGGLGNHRYPIGFSGDSVVRWESLAFQPYFTATASNVDYGWWSHDIGGHMGGVEDGEQFARWVQFGAFSPILRLHSTKNPFQDRRPWGYDQEVYQTTKEAMQLRHALIPYLYSMAWRFHSKSVPPILPMYFEHAEKEAAYACPNQYLFGSQLLVAPFTSPKEEQTQLTRQVVWLPEGGWYGFFDGLYHPAGWYSVYGQLKDIPVYARAGAIVPLAKKVNWGGIDNPENLDVYIFPGANGYFELYEDDGYSNTYLDAKHAITRFDQIWNTNSLTFQIHPSEGDISQVPPRRAYDLHFRGILKPTAVTVQVNGKAQKFGFKYDAEKRTLTLDTIWTLPTDELEIKVEGTPSGLAFKEDPRKETALKLIRLMRMETRAKTELSENLEQYFVNPDGLARYRLQLSDSHFQALLETILGAGMERTNNHGGDLVVVWNNHKDARAVRTFNAYIPGRWSHWFNLYMDRESAGLCEVYRPGKEFKQDQWNLRLDLAGIFTEEIGEG